MSKTHERWVCALLGAVRSPASGSQWANPIDGRQNHMTEKYAFAFDGKATLGKSVGVSRDMWEKARRQAGAERPMLALRFYDDERLTVGYDLIVVDAHDFAELLEAANDGPDA